MISFRQFLLNEKVSHYRSNWRGGVSHYDDTHFDKKIDTLKSDDGKIVAYKHKLVPKKHSPDVDSLIKKSDDVIHRGMSHREYHNMLKHGKIQSHGKANIGDDQKGLTYYTKEPSAAESYANSFAGSKHKPNLKKHAYIVSVKKPHETRIKHVEGTASHEVGVHGHISTKDIVAVHRGRVIDHTPAEKGRGFSSAARSRLHWERIK